MNKKADLEAYRQGTMRVGAIFAEARRRMTQQEFEDFVMSRKNASLPVAMLVADWADHGHVPTNEDLRHIKQLHEFNFEDGQNRKLQETKVPITFTTH